MDYPKVVPLVTATANAMTTMMEGPPRAGLSGRRLEEEDDDDDEP